MAKSRKEWTEAGYKTCEDLSAAGHRVLHVGDGAVGHATVLDGDEEVRDALADYMAEYDSEAYDRAGRVRLRWVLFVAGSEQDDGVADFVKGEQS